MPEHSLTILHYEDHTPPADLIAIGAKTIAVSTSKKHWLKRTLWESFQFGKLAKQLNADIVLNVSGGMTPRCPVPQVVLCQNPWAYRPMAHLNFKERIKAALQRRGYASAYRNAAMMIYISGHLQSLYRAGNPGVQETRSEIAYVGLNEDTYQAARDWKDLEREPLTILSVSAMASWKGAETLVDAVALLHQRDIPARLKLVGPWPQPQYRQQIETQIQRLNLTDCVEILGKVSDSELHQLYATSGVYALMSSCESFGIPAAEAMAFGTPVISTTCCAIAEICQPAGLFGPLVNPTWTADALQELLTDQVKWDHHSQAARKQAATLTWQECSQPLLKLTQLLKPKS